MKGIIFNLFEQVVTDEYGEQTWEALCDEAGVAGVYAAAETYPDPELQALVAAASERLDLPPDDVLRWFGRSALRLLAELYPSLFEGHGSLRSFVGSLSDVVYPEVRRLFPGAETPRFDVETPSPGVVVLGYDSRRDLCPFAEGLLEGAAEYYGEAVRITQRRCVRRGDGRCVLVCSYRRL